MQLTPALFACTARPAAVPWRPIAWLRVAAVCGVLVFATGLSAQRADTATGSVTGRVLCNDTNGPARLASVVLVPIVDTSFLPKASSGGKEVETPHEPLTKVVETGLDGSFTVPHVRPGSYYVVPEKSGYLRPLALLTREQLNKPDEETARLMARLLTPVTVVGDHSTAVEARLVRGAAMSGTVRFDDGTAASGVRIAVWLKDKTGKWGTFRGNPVHDSSSAASNDQGSFRVTGLPAGEYLVEARVESEDVYVDHIFAGDGSSSSNTHYELGIFYGDAYRTRDAKIVKLAEGEEAPSIDVTVRLGQFHTLSGSVLAADGHTANAARVALLWNDDKSSLVSTVVRAEDNAFHFEYVPEGEYTLRVTDARDVTREDVPNCPQCVPPFHTEEKTIHHWGNGEQTLLLHTDVQAVNVTVMPAAVR